MDGKPFIQFKAEGIHLNIADVFEVHGNFAFTRVGNQFQVGGADIEIFMGSILTGLMTAR